ncbi:hypothetical protein VYU27_009657 [Nannochloropsis oceanica]
MTAQHALPPLPTVPSYRPLHLAQRPQSNIKTRSSSRGSCHAASSSSPSSSFSPTTKQPARAVPPSPPSSSSPPTLRRRLCSSMASSKRLSSSSTSLSSSYSFSSTTTPHRKPKKASSLSTAGKGGDLLTSGYFYMALLALQFGMQPILVRAFIPKSTPKMPIVMATEAVKILLCAVGLLVTEKKSARDKMWATWTFRESLRLGAVPAALYALQNTMAQFGYQYLDSLSFNLLNQTKTLAAAVCLYFVLGKKQTPLQLVALCMLLTASIILNWPASASSSSSSSSLPVDPLTFTMGVVPCLLASLTSGVCAALTQKTLQGLSRNSYLYSAELAFYGQICLALLIAARYITDTGGEDAPSFSLPEGVGPLTLLPVVMNAAGGIIVGLVTKYAGGVKKGFALIAGIALTAFCQSVAQQTPPSRLHLFAACLVALSTHLHAKHNDAWYAERAAKKGM